MRLSIVKHYQCLLQDLGIDKESHDYLVRRLKSEGPRFVTVILPSLWKVVLTSIERGRFDFGTLTSFARKKKLPKVFFGLFCKIFSTKGILLDNPCADALLTIRQACEYYYKCSFTFTPQDIDAAEKKYLSVEAELSDESDLDHGFIDMCRKNFETYYHMSDTTTQDVLAYARPRFGPGSAVVPLHVEQSKVAISTPPAVSSRGKVVNTTPLARLNSQQVKLSSGSLVGTCNTRQRAFLGFFKAYPKSQEETLVIEEGRKTEVLFVPKDSRGPRVISREPLYLLKMQMSFLKWGCDTLEKVTERRINFADQSINRELARRGSITRNWDTFDLKDASDRVRHSVARTIFKQSPAFRFFINNMRSTHYELPSDIMWRKEACKRLKKPFHFNDPQSVGRKLNKLSGMGSGITFPIMSLIIHLSVCTEVKLRTGLPYQEIMKNVYVYGDDLIVPKAYSAYVRTALRKVGLLLNQEKSFTQGPFRESCGGDYINGVEVVPVRFKMSGLKLPTVELARNGFEISTQACASLERHSRELVKKGLDRTAEYLYSLIESTLEVSLPDVHGRVPYMGRYKRDSSSVYAQTTQAKVYYPSPVVARAYAPCPYKHLGKKLSRATERASALYESSVQSFKAFDFLNPADPFYLLDKIDDYFDNAASALFGQFDERYALCLKVRKNVPAFCLTGRP